MEAQASNAQLRQFQAREHESNAMIQSNGQQPCLNRRKFNRQIAALTGGCVLAHGGTQGPKLQFIYGDETEDLNPEAANTSTDRLIELGLNALARSPEMNYFADGHRGAALISAHYLCDEFVDQPDAQTRIAELLDINYSTTKLCAQFPNERPDPNAIRKIGETLAKRGDQLLQVGHNAIFAMLAIKAFRLAPQLATPQRVEGVCELIRRFTPWNDTPPDPAIQPPSFTDQKAISQFILQEASDAIDRFVGFGQGFAGHMMTFGHSLVELASMGDVEWAESCRTAFCKYVTVTRKGPSPEDRRIKDHLQTKLRPTDTKYWQDRPDRSVGIGHVFKYPYAYYDLAQRAGDAAIVPEMEAKAWHVF